MTRAADGSSASVRARVEASLPGLSKKQQVVAHYLLDDPTGALFATAGELAKRTEVDPATVVRLAQRLGYAGHTELRDALRGEFAMSSPLERWDEDVAPVAGDLTKVIERVHRQTLANVERTFGQLDAGALAAMLEAVVSAERCVVTGNGQSRALAVQLQRVLQVAQIRTQTVEDWSELAFEASTFGNGDVAIGITVWQYTRATVETLRVAHEAGARTVLVTDVAFAPGAEYVDIVLLFAPQAIGEYMSPAAGAALIDCIAAGLAARVPDRVKRAMTSLYEIMQSAGLSYR
jgi:RpiR family carbohydrate utilization transcriptional regulator